MSEVPLHAAELLESLQGLVRLGLSTDGYMGLKGTSGGKVMRRPK